MEPNTRSDCNQRPLARSLSAVLHVILDRDGVLNEEPAHGAYVVDPKSFRWLPGALDALATFRASGIRISVATNQSGIGRGLMTEADVSAIHEKMTAEASQAFGSIDAVFYCPHAPDAGCDCRKPLPGLIEAAISQSGISHANTLMIGDAARDLDAAYAAGVRAALVRTGQGAKHAHLGVARGIPIFDTLSALAAELTLIRDPFMERTKDLERIFAEHAAVVAESVTSLLPTLAKAIDASRRCLSTGGKIFVCGNGGSAADAQHFVAELVGRYHASRRALPAIALTSDPATFTAVSNDFGFEHVFARQVEAFGSPGDLLIALSTSGNSQNVLNAALSARERGCTVIGLTGRTGGELRRLVDVAICVPSDTVARIQELHGLCLHAMAEALDSVALDAGPA